MAQRRRRRNPLRAVFKKVKQRPRPSRIRRSPIGFSTPRPAPLPQPGVVPPPPPPLPGPVLPDSTQQGELIFDPPWPDNPEGVEFPSSAQTGL